MLNRRNALKLTAAAAAGYVVLTSVAAASPATDPVAAIIPELHRLSSDQLENLCHAACRHLVVRGEFAPRVPYWAVGMGWMDWDEADAIINDPERRATRPAACQERSAA
jgi:hypothetical protein